MRTVRILVMFFLCLFFLNIAWAIDIETGDFPLDSRDICDDHPYGKWAALSAASWSPGYWDLGESNRKIWAPNRAGVRVTYDNKVIIRFVLSDNDVKFLSLNFKDTDTRIPWGLEIDVVDHDNILGEKEVPDFSFTDNLPSEARVIYDTGALDDTNQLSVLITRPDELSPNKIYEIVFTPNQIHGNSGTLHFVFQLTLNYKYLTAMKNNNSVSCDFLDLCFRVTLLSV